MRPLIIFLSVLILTLPSNANASDGDENYDEVLAALIGVPVALTSSILFPLVGFAIDSREDRPYYWRVVGSSAFASIAGVGIVYARYDEDDHDDDVREFIRYPLLFSAVTTVLTHILLTRPTDKTSSASWQYAPQVSVLPVARGGSLRLNWSF